MFLSLAQQRRTIYQFTSQPVEAEKITYCLQAAIWAPNHGLTQPWHFYVVGDKTKQKLTEIYATTRAAKRAQKNTSEYDDIYAKACDRFLANPQIVLVGQQRSNDPIQTKEDYAACACAIQNFQLAAWEQGIGVQWSSGPIINQQQTYQILGLDSQQIELIGILYIGYAQCVPDSTRKPLSEVVSYID